MPKTYKSQAQRAAAGTKKHKNGRPAQKKKTVKQIKNMLSFRFVFRFLGAFCKSRSEYTV